VHRTELATALFAASHLTGEFRLRSGRTATEYFDKYRFESDPRLLAEIADQLAPLVPAGTELLAGLELGGVPIATALSLRTGLPAVFVRKQAKTYGTAKLAEGVDVEGRRLLVVEDVVTSGGQVALSAADLRERGARVAEALCVVDRGEGGREALAADDIALQALFTGDELRAAA
jgi:orotate phosphoribosyltransferase